MSVWIRMMATSFATWQQVYLRLLVAAVLALIVFRKGLGSSFWSQITPRDWVIYVLRSFAAFTVGIGFVTVAVQHTQISTVSFISSVPVLALFAWVMFRERVKPDVLVVIAISFVGLGLITNFDLANFRLGLGELSAIICLVGFDISYVMARMHNPKFSNYQNTAVLLLIGWVPLLILSLLSHEKLPTHVGLIAWIGLAASAIMNLTGLYLVNYVFSNLKAHVAGNILLLEGVFAMIVGFVLYGEALTVHELIGAAIIIVSAYAVGSLEARRDRLAVAQSELE
jgi:drug/metabolite transporter (DMT)-like permease